MSPTAAALLEKMCSGALGDVDQVGLQDLLGELRECVGRLTGRLQQVLGELDARGDGAVRTNPHSEGPALYQPVQGWWRDRAILSGGQAGREVRLAGVLRELPVIAEAVVAGVLSPAQAAALSRLHGRIPQQDLLDSQSQLVEVAAAMNQEVLAQWVRHLIATHCEPSLDLEQSKARDKRYLQLAKEPDGTVRGRFVLASEDAEVVLSVLEPLARPDGAADKRSAGQRRADAFVDVFAGAAKWMDLPDAGGQRANVSIVVNGDWAAGAALPSLPEQLARQGLHPHLFDASCASGAWTGPMTRARVEAELCDARLSRLVLDGRGEVVALHSLNDSITRAQRRAVAARDRCCVVRGCNRPPAFTDVHHLIHLEHGGTTTVDNLVLLCRRHHVAWHRGHLDWGDLHTPWLDQHGGWLDEDDPWSGHAPPLIA
jgi:hypothetical protein